MKPKLLKGDIAELTGYLEERYEVIGSKVHRILEERKFDGSRLGVFLGWSYRRSGVQQRYTEWKPPQELYSQVYLADSRAISVGIFILLGTTTRYKPPFAVAVNQIMEDNSD